MARQIKWGCGQLSPLRYPGGKGRLAPFFEGVIRGTGARHFAETHAGGAGMGLHFLFRGLVDGLNLNDLDHRVHAFWQAALAEGCKFADAIRTVPLDIEEWHRQRQTCFGAESNGFDLGFSTFYLNRTNFCGVLDGRPIGGLEQQGKYKLDARFNRATLAARVEAVSERAESISVSNLDAADFLAHVGPDTLVFLDPPYLDKERLYGPFPDGTRELAEALRTARFPWIMTINDDAGIRDMFQWTNMRNFNMRYSFRNSVKGGSELLIWGNIDDEAFDFQQKIFAAAA